MTEKNIAFIGAGAVVTKDVPDHALMVGNPARQRGSVCECGGRLDGTPTCVECKNTLEYKSLTTISE